MSIFERVNELIMEGKYAVAEQMLTETIISVSEDFLTQQLLLGEVLYRQDRYSESIQLIESIAPKLNQNQLLDALYYLVLNYYRINEPRGVIFYGTSHLRLTGQVPFDGMREVQVYMYSYIAEAYADRGDTDNAVNCLTKMNELCQSPENWLQYYISYAYIMVNHDVIVSFQHCLSALRLSSSDSLLEDTDSVLFRLFDCCIAVRDYNLAKILLKVLQDHYYEIYGDRIEQIKEEYIPKISFQYLPLLCQKTAYAKEILSELKRLKLLG